MSTRCTFKVRASRMKTIVFTNIRICKQKHICKFEVELDVKLGA